MEVAVNVASTRLENNHFEVVLKIAATAKTNDKTIFVVELSYGGIASSNVTDEKMLHPLIAIEGPRLLFPFARAVVANITREGGFLPLNLNPIDFLALYQQNMAQQQVADSAPEKANDDFRKLKAIGLFGSRQSRLPPDRVVHFVQQGMMRGQLFGACSKRARRADGFVCYLKPG